jgi:hypothetical protein
MPVQITSNKPADAAALERWTKSLPGRLPADYLRFLQQSNGGKPQPNRCPDMRGEFRFSVRTLLGITGSSDTDLGAHMERFRGRVPGNMIPIGYDDCGNLFVLSIAGKDAGCVYFWDHELEADEGEPPRTDKLTRVAVNFAAFLRGLKRFDPASIKLNPGDVKSVWIDPEFGKMIAEQEKREQEGA